MELFTLAMLLTLPGATAAVLLIVQFIKPFRIFQKVDTRILAWVIALVIVMVVTILTRGTVEQFVLAGFNSFVIASAAMGAYTVTFAKADAAKKAEIPDGGGVAGS